MSAPIRARGLVVVRESGEWDQALFNGMREQTYAVLRHVPQVDAVRTFGLRPLTEDRIAVSTTAEGKPVTETIAVHRLVAGGTQASLFYYQGYFHLWSCASAASGDHTDVNDFATVLMRVIEQLRPHDLYLSSVSRLARSQRKANKVVATIDGCVDRVHVGRNTFDLTDPQALQGRVLFSRLFRTAARERDEIVQRLSAASIAAGAGQAAQRNRPDAPSADGAHR